MINQSAMAGSVRVRNVIATFDESDAFKLIDLQYIMLYYMADHPSSGSPPAGSYAATSMPGVSDNAPTSLTRSDAVMKKTAKTFPAHSGETIIYTEYEGHGHPPHDLGRPGDIYIDMSVPKRLHARVSWWQEWTGITGNALLATIKHPLDMTRVLWCSPTDISWRKSSGLGTSIKRLRDSSPEFSNIFSLPGDRLIELYLSSQKDISTASSTKRKRKAPDSTYPIKSSGRNSKRRTNSQHSTHLDQNTATSSAGVTQTSSLLVGLSD